MERDRPSAGEAGRGFFQDTGPATFTPAAPPPRLLPRLTITTDAVPRQTQFAFWQASMAAHLDLSRPRSRQGDAFPASSTSWRFGSLMLSQTRLPPCNYRRSAAHIRRDSLDHWIIAICRRGLQRQRSGEVDIEMQRGLPYVFSMAEPFEAERAGTEMDWLTLYVPRDSAVELERPLAALRNRPLDGALGALLGDHLAALEECMPQLSEAEGARLATATLAVLAAAIMPRAEADFGAGDRMAELQRARIKRLIRENLGAATLGPARLCAQAGMSRSQLYRLLEPSGGVARHIQLERLRAAYRLLADPAERRGIARVAEAVGFFEPSTFSRAFRQEYGCSPRDVRMAAKGGCAPGGGREQRQKGARTFLNLLHDL